LLLKSHVETHEQNFGGKYAVRISTVDVFVLHCAMLQTQFSNNKLKKIFGWIESYKGWSLGNQVKAFHYCHYFLSAGLLEAIIST
jgi:hypothetical protein